jgi:hypothetical protein
MSIEDDRKQFNSAAAPKIAAQIGIAKSWDEPGSSRFAYFVDDNRFLVVAGPQEQNYTDLAFALGLSYRGDRQLVLALPRDHAFATLQRAPWFTGTARPEIHLHDGVTAKAERLPRQSDTVDRAAAIKPGVQPRDELRQAATPKHLGAASSAVYELVEWATTHPLLDNGHRRGERSWHCMGQKVLSIKSTKEGGLAITAGIHYSKPGEAPSPLALAKAEHLTASQLGNVKAQVEEGIEARLHGPPPIHRPDEHWLQAVIRGQPTLVGVEQPALRELPAWRPAGDGSPASWGRGYIDLLGVDGHGDIRIVETKLADNVDDLLVFQGLDYYIWSLAYRHVLTDRLGAPDSSELEIHYVVGATTGGKIHVSRHAGAQVRSLDPKVHWRFQTIHGWYPTPASASEPKSALLPPGELP